MALGGLVNPIDPTNPLSQDCAAYTTRGVHPTGSSYANTEIGGDDFTTYLRFVQVCCWCRAACIPTADMLARQGGYTSEQFNAYTSGNKAQAAASVQQCLGAVLKAVYGSNSTDASYPQCSTRLRWNVGNYGTNEWQTAGGSFTGQAYDTALRSVIWSLLDTTTCNYQWLADVLNTVGPAYNVGLDDWTSSALFVIPDPDPTYIVVQPGFAGTTLIDLVQQFATAQLSPVVTPTFYGANSYPPAGVATSPNGVVLYNTTMPAVYDKADPTFGAYQTSLTPTSQFDLGIEVYALDPETPETCVFLPEDDPNIQAAYTQDPANCQQTHNQSSDGVDYLWKCGQQTCSKIPVAYKRNGLYGCRYTPSAAGVCDENSNSQCVYGQLNKLYQQFVLCYQTLQSVPPPLPTVPLPWLPGPGWGTGFSFVLADAAKYQANIQPDKTKPIMCVIDTTASEAVNFSQCTSPHYERLKQHVQANYLHNGGVVVPPLQQLEWTVERTLLADGVILAFTQTDRPINSTYMQGLFDDASVCQGVVTSNERVCYHESAEKTMPVNPWLLGYWNPFSMLVFPTIRLQFTGAVLVLTTLCQQV